MNETHLQYLASDDWAAKLESDLLPWIERVGDLGDDVLEVGPGPGLTTDILRLAAAVVTAVEIDHALAAALADRLADTNVDVHEGDAAAMAFAADRFTAATAFLVLHHVPSVRNKTRSSARSNGCSPRRPPGRGRRPRRRLPPRSARGRHVRAASDRDPRGSPGGRRLLRRGARGDRLRDQVRGTQARQSVVGNPRSMTLVAGSGQRVVTTLGRV